MADNKSLATTQINGNVPTQNSSIPPLHDNMPAHPEKMASLEANESSGYGLPVESRPFENIVNFRDVGASCTTKSDGDIKRYIKEGVFFRSGRLDDASTVDLELLTSTYKIRTIVDLRSETEGKIGDVLANTFPAAAIAAVKPTDMVLSQILPPHIEDKLNKLDAKHVIVASETVNSDKQQFSTDSRHARQKSTVVAMDELKKEISESKEGLATRTTYFINFAGSKYRYHCVLKPCPISLKLKIIALMIIGRKAAAIREVGARVLQRKGLKGLNHDFIDYCGEQIVQVIRIMIASATYPILIHCTQGKDRTGLVVAIVLSLCDVPRPLIVQDYVKTQQGLEAQRDIMAQEMAKTGLDPSFSDAPEEVIIDALEYIDSKYGGVEDYVKNHDLRDDEIRSLRVILIAEGMSKQSNVNNANTVVTLRQNGYDDLVS